MTKEITSFPTLAPTSYPNWTCDYMCNSRVSIMVFNTTFSNITVISVLLVEETRVFR